MSSLSSALSIRFNDDAVAESQDLIADCAAGYNGGRRLRGRQFIGVYGACCDIVARLWLLARQKLTQVGCGPRQLLWALHFLKTYTNEHESASMFGIDEKTLRKWRWIVVEVLANLKLVRLIFFLGFFSKF
jgi:hypothetical protein